MLLISLDFDGVVTEDEALWVQFMALARRRGHDVITVTSRIDTPENRQEILSVLGDDHVVVFAHDKPKKLAAIEHGWHVDVWIDDQPHIIGSGGESLATVGVFENELRHAHKVLTECSVMSNWQYVRELVTRIETVLGKA